MSSRRFVYLMSFTTPMISMSVCVPGSVPNPRWRADGILPREIAARKLLVDHHRRRRPVVRLRPLLDLAVVLGGEVSPRHDGHAEGREIVRTDLVHERLRMVIGSGRIVAFHGHPAVPFVVFENAH